MSGRVDDATVASIVAEVAGDGFPSVRPEDVRDVVSYGSVPEGVVSDEYDEALTDRILAALDARGIST